MGKGCKVVVCGQAAVGKTAILEQLLYGNHSVGKHCTWIIGNAAAPAAHTGDIVIIVI